MVLGLFSGNELEEERGDREREGGRERTQIDRERETEREGKRLRYKDAMRNAVQQE